MLAFPRLYLGIFFHIYVSNNYFHFFKIRDVTTSRSVTSQLEGLWRHNFKVCDVTGWRPVTSSILPLLQRVGGNFRISAQIFDAGLQRRFLAVSVLSTKKFYLYKRANFLLPKRRIGHLCWIGIVTYQLPPCIWFSVTYEPWTSHLLLVMW